MMVYMHMEALSIVHSAFAPQSDRDSNYLAGRSLGRTPHPRSLPEGKLCQPLGSRPVFFPAPLILTAFGGAWWAGKKFCLGDELF